MASGFDDVVCDAPLPAGATNVAVEGTRLPSPPRAPRTIVVFGDTGCRMLGDEQQNCGDIADWPFPKIAQTIAAVHPDLLVHVGDYYYRENNCPPSMTKCQNRWGDTSMSWDADWFSPGKPRVRGRTAGDDPRQPRGLRARRARMVPVSRRRGHRHAVHRRRRRRLAAVGASRSTGCASSSRTPPPIRATATRTPRASRSTRRRSARAQTLAAGTTGEAWFVTHRPPFANTNQTQALLGLGWHFAPFGTVLAGHVHDFEAINLTGFPSLIVNGESGDDLDDAGSTAKYIGFQKNNGRPVYTFASPAPFATKQYGFAVYSQTATGWAISLRDADGIERRACALAKGIVSCP